MNVKKLVAQVIAGSQMNERKPLQRTWKMHILMG